MADSSFRRLDVDQYDEDRVLPSDLYIPDSRAPATVLADTQGKATAVRGLLQRGDVRGALGEVLVDAPYGEGVDDAKVSGRRLGGYLQLRADLLLLPWCSLAPCARCSRPKGDADPVSARYSLQAIALQSILSILNSTKSTDIPAIVSDLNSLEQVRPLPPSLRRRDRMLTRVMRKQVTLMKYLYKAMENLGETSGNVVLGWHEKVRLASASSLISS